ALGVAAAVVAVNLLRTRQPPRRALFSARDARRYRIALAGVGAILVAMPAGLMIRVRTRAATGEGHSVAQPMWFDHRHHAGAFRIPCLYCHTEALRSATAG